MSGSDDTVEPDFDPRHPDAIARAIGQLSAEEAQFFLEKLERMIRKRKIQLTGYLLAIGMWLVGMVIALYVYGTADEGTFVGWIFFVPFGLVGLVLYTVGKYAERVAKGGGSATPEIREKLLNAQAGATGAKPTKPSKAGKPGTPGTPDVVSRAPASAKSAKPE